MWCPLCPHTCCPEVTLSPPPPMLSSEAGSQTAHGGRPGEDRSEIQEARQECTFCSIWIARDFRGPFSCLLAEEFYFGAGGASTQLFGTYASSRGLSHPQQLWLTVLVALKPLVFIFGVERLPHAPVFEYLVLGRWLVSGRWCGDCFSCPLESPKRHTLLGVSVRVFLGRVNHGGRLIMNVGCTISWLPTLNKNEKTEKEKARPSHPVFLAVDAT